MISSRSRMSPAWVVEVLEERSAYERPAHARNPTTWPRRRAARTLFFPPLQGQKNDVAYARRPEGSTAEQWRAGMLRARAAVRGAA